MAAPTLRLSTYLSPFVIVFALSVQPQQLKTINSPGGGTIVYGQVAGQTTEAGAMGAVLRSVHQSVGEKPQVGKLFQVHGTESVAAFFSATRRNGNGGQVAGIIIATKVSSDHVEAALITDEATRFHRTLPANMKTLFAAWHPLRDAAASSAPSGPADSVATLHQQVLPDRSASVGLPDNWRVAPNASGGGTIVAIGPDGENAFLGVAFQAMDTNNPAVQQTMRQLQAGRLQNTQYARGAYFLTAPICKRLSSSSSTRRATALEILRPTSPSPPFHRCKATDVSIAHTSPELSTSRIKRARAK